MTNAFIPITLSEIYRINSDGIQYIVETKRTVDPTRSPSWDAKVAKAAAEGQSLDSSPRIEWGDPKYYPLTYRGLAACVEHVAIRSVTTHDRMTMSDYLAAIREETNRILGVVSPLLRDFTA